MHALEECHELALAVRACLGENLFQIGTSGRGLDAGRPSFSAKQRQGHFVSLPAFAGVDVGGSDIIMPKGIIRLCFVR